MRTTLKVMAILIMVAVLGVGFWGYAPDTDPKEMRAQYGSQASQFIALEPGLTVHVRDEGKRDGPALLLIHGSNASLHTWEPWVARLGDTYRIITLDLPGHGLTGTHPKGVYDYPVFVDVVKRVMDRLSVTRAVIGGNSMGGGTAWMFALAHPDKTAALILIDAAGAPRWESRDTPIGFRLARTPVLRDLMRVITPRSVFESSLKTSIYDPALATPVMVDRYWELNRFPGNREATLQRFSYLHNNHPATKEQLAALKMPVLVMWGEEDNLIPVSSADWFASAIPGAEKVIYPKIGHIPMEEMPDKSAADVRQFLAEIDTPLNQ